MLMSISGLKRDTIDKFYTKNDVVNMCLKEIQTHININSELDLIIEPSAGNGAFMPIISLLSKNYFMFVLMIMLLINNQI
jgi:hypothetical protein